MDKIMIRGGIPLRGEVEVSGSKNSSLPLLFASLLTGEACRFRRVPQLVDIKTALRLLQELGVEVSQTIAGPERGGEASGEVVLRANRITQIEAPYDLVKTMRASFLVLGPLLTRFGQARVSTPGGCAIGTRPINLHLQGLAQLGASIRLVQGYVEAKAPRLKGAKIHLDFPSVGATENLMMAATLAEGTTVIENAAREPEIGDLAAALNNMGACIYGAGSDVITIEGRDELSGIEHEVIPDRVEAGTYMIAAAITSGDLFLRGAQADHLGAFILKLQEAGVTVEENHRGIQITGNGRPSSVDIKTLPYPGFPTDLQAQMMALMTLADSQSVITESIFENRFMHAQELARMGADIRVRGNNAIVRGVAILSGAPVMATDLRASVSLILAGLAAQGVTTVSRIYHLDRGYERIAEKLSRLGADISRVKT